MVGRRRRDGREDKEDEERRDRVEVEDGEGKGLKERGRKRVDRWSRAKRMG